MRSSPDLVGFFDGFEGYRSVGEEQLAPVLGEGIVALDTNVLLDLYRYSESAREEFLDVLRRIRTVLFLPAQARLEFWRQRDHVLEDLATAAARQPLDDARKTLRNTVQSWENRTRAMDEVTDLIAEADILFDRIEQKMHATVGALDAAAALWNTAKDPVVVALAELLDGRAAPLLDPDDRKALIDAGLRRFADDVPPGNEDWRKKGEEAGTGDYLIWEELIQRAVQTNSDVLLVTRDQKPDWWRKDRQNAPLVAGMK